MYNNRQHDVSLTIVRAWIIVLFGFSRELSDKTKQTGIEFSSVSPFSPRKSCAMFSCEGILSQFSLQLSVRKG